MHAFFRTRTALWLALPVGALLSLAFAPFDLWPLAWLCPAYLFLMWHNACPRRAAQAGFIFTAGTYLAGTYWLYHSIHEIGHAPFLLTLLVMCALVTIMAAYSACIGYALTRWFGVGAAPDDSGAAVRSDARDPPIFAAAASPRQGWLPGLHFMLLLPAAWTVLEWFRGWFLSGFPWLALGYTHIDTALAGFAPVGGVYSMSFLIALCAGALAAAWRGGTGIRLVALGTIASVWLAGLALTKQTWTQPLGGTVSVAIVQGAVPQEMKWSPEMRDATIDLYRDLTRPSLGADIIVWPEAALPALAHDLIDVLSEQWTQASDKGSALVLGQLRYDSDSRSYYNAVLALDEEPQWYAKRRLVPFSEFFPVPEWVRGWLRGMDLPYSGFQAGGRDQRALDAGGQKLAASICYEDSYGSDQLSMLEEATLLVNVTNDAWFGDSTAAYQHLQISRTRALEAGRMLLRAANDGISAIIAADGRIVASLPRFVPGVLSGNVQPRTGLTPYARGGNWPIVSLCMAILLTGLYRGRRQSLKSAGLTSE
ncbi:apolipoprotein N-acyltransferase [Steroidobacter denitrificans]|uniref:Apolipoprotein N-acyltransferase n=1 Tax=Steroidobacter denitrificans TaxID=465721 RepID=A0A127F7X8_STEDE|nr:apolipoprotein N-acyltransferase [Steroidobacter denitrificans]AMN46553.1 apolipoprotein N-acyltransferase [Steroidobacter denitrificans]